MGGGKTRHPNLCFLRFHLKNDSILRLTFCRAAFGVFPGFKDLRFKDLKKFKIVQKSKKLKAKSRMAKAQTHGEAKPKASSQKLSE